MTFNAVGDHRAQRLVVDVAAAAVGGTGIAQIGFQRLFVRQWQNVYQAEGVLLVHILQFGVVVASSQILGEFVVAAEEAERISGSAAGCGDAATATGGQGDIFIVIGVTAVDLAHMAHVQGQTVDFLGNQMASLENLRQQTAVAGGNGLVLELHTADTQGAFGNLGFGCDSQTGVIVLRPAGRTIRNQQTAARSAITGIQLETEHADGIRAKAYGAFGEARLSAQDKALRPLFLLVLGSAWLTQVTVEVEVTRFDAGFAVANKIGKRRLAQGQAQGAGRDGQGQGGLSHYDFSSCVWVAHRRGRGFTGETAGAHRIRGLNTAPMAGRRIAAARGRPSTGGSGGRVKAISADGNIGDDQQAEVGHGEALFILIGRPTTWPL